MTKNCAFPPELDDKQLLTYLDGAADEKVAYHLSICDYCREKAEALDRLQKHLTNELYRLTCPPSIELGEYHLRMLPASRMLVVAQHVRECPHCAREIDQLEGFLMEEAPVEGLLGRAKVLIARLIGGEPGFAPATVLRGETKGPLTFAAEGIAITLDVQPAAAGVLTLLGQVAAEDQDDWTGAQVELRRDNRLLVSGTVDDLGAFICEGVSPGQQELRIIPKNGSVVLISNFEVPA